MNLLTQTGIVISLLLVPGLLVVFGCPVPCDVVHLFPQLRMRQPFQTSPMVAAWNGRNGSTAGCTAGGCCPWSMRSWKLPLWEIWCKSGSWSCRLGEIKNAAGKGLYSCTCEESEFKFKCSMFMNVSTPQVQSHGASFCESLETTPLPSHLLTAFPDAPEYDPPPNTIWHWVIWRLEALERADLRLHKLLEKCGILAEQVQGYSVSREVSIRPAVTIRKKTTNMKLGTGKLSMIWFDQRFLLDFFW